MPRTEVNRIWLLLRLTKRGKSQDVPYKPHQNQGRGSPMPGWLGFCRPAHSRLLMVPRSAASGKELSQWPAVKVANVCDLLQSAAYHLDLDWGWNPQNGDLREQNRANLRVNKRKQRGSVYGPVGQGYTHEGGMPESWHCVTKRIDATCPADYVGYRSEIQTSYDCGTRMRKMSPGNNSVSPVSSTLECWEPFLRVWVPLAADCIWE